MVMQRPNLLVLALLLSFAAPRSIRAGGAFSLESDHEEARARGSKPSYSPMLADLSTLSFDHNVGNGSTWFVMLYAPWCGLCKANKPKLVDVAEHYAGNSSVSIGMVDATLQLSLAVRFGVTSFPKFVLVEGGSTYRVYDRVAPPAEAIIDFIDNDAYSDSVLVSGALNPFNPQSPLHRGALFFHPLRVLLYAIDSYILPLEPTTRLGVAPVMVPDPTAQVRLP
jgi:thiol-disulfide isomerase/thioredoxin